jgi:hypothetical protein
MEVLDITEGETTWTRGDARVGASTWLDAHTWSGADARAGAQTRTGANARAALYRVFY